MVSNKEKKQYTGFLLEFGYKKEIEEIAEHPMSLFESEAQIIRYCIKKVLPDIKAELEERKNNARK